jgi:hypothetical protein
MNKFNPDSKCVKCGCDDIASHHCQERCLRCWTWPIEHREPLIHRACRRCGYSWNELPLDAPEAAGVSTADDVEPGPDYPRED